MEKPGYNPMSVNNEEIHNLWYIHIMEYYLAIKRNELWTHTTTWMDLEGIKGSEKANFTGLHIT